MNTSPVNLRNLERIHESSGGSSHRLATLLLAATGMAAVLVVGWSMRERQPAQEGAKKDPLAALVAQESAKQEEANELSASELDFPDVLSDADSRTTALVAVKNKHGQLIPPPESAPSAPLVPNDPLPSIPLPAGTELAQTSVTAEPKDELTQLALQASQIPEGTSLSEPGTEGGFLVQVASFKDQDDAEEFVLKLRKRGHRAFRQAANVPGRGIWHRVRIGSFQNKYEAELYKKRFEEQERTIALVIDPDKVERAQKVRAQKLAERIRQQGSP